MSKRILILSDSIAPPAYAPRVVSLTRYLCQKGWEVVVFSDCENGVIPFADQYGRWEHTAYYQSGHSHWRYIADKVFGQREHMFQAHIEATVDVASYDAILCSTCYYFPLQTTYRLARKYSKPFIVDLRDIAEQWGDIPYLTHSVLPSRRINRWLHKIFTSQNLRQRNRVIQAANYLTTISPWHQQLLSKINPCTALIYNGFDENEFYPENRHTDQFILSYTGKIYDLHFRDPRLLFEAMQQLIAKQQIDASKVEIRFHIDGPSIEPLRQLVARYGLRDVCRIENYIPKEELLPLLHRSSILLVLTCLSTPDGAHGIMGTKFYEALGAEKPVLCIRSDEECLAQVVQETNAGLAGTNAQQVTQLVLDKYHEWEQNGFTRQNVVQTEKKRFTRQYESAQFEQLILHILTSKS